MLRSGSLTLFLQFQVFFFWLLLEKNVYKLNGFIDRKGCVLLLSKKLEPILKKVKTRGRCFFDVFHLLMTPCRSILFMC